MTGRIYKLKRKRRINYFDPQAYNDAAKLINSVTTPVAREVDVIVSKDDTNIAFVLSAVLKQNGLSPTRVNSTRRRIKYHFADNTKRNKAFNLLSSIKGDSLSTSSVSFDMAVPIGVSRNGVTVPLEGYTISQKQNNDSGSSSLSNQVTRLDDLQAEMSGINWYLVGGAALIGVILVLAIVKLAKKK